MQALKYPSAHAVTLYMPGFIKIDKTKIAAAAQFSENLYIYQVSKGIKKKKLKKILVARWRPF